MEGRQVNDDLKGCGRKHGICLEGLRKTMKKSVRIASVQAEILTLDLSQMDTFIMQVLCLIFVL
jgi:hypothetical protein